MVVQDTTLSEQEWDVAPRNHMQHSPRATIPHRGSHPQHFEWHEKLGNPITTFAFTIGVGQDWFGLLQAPCSRQQIRQFVFGPFHPLHFTLKEPYQLQQPHPNPSVGLVVLDTSIALSAPLAISSRPELSTLARGGSRDNVITDENLDKE